MSDELKRKLYDFETIPSDQVWDKIVSALDQEINAEFPQRLYESEVTPPVHTWNKIASTLNADLTEEYPEKLYNLEVAPPPAAWQKISTALDEESALPRIPNKRRIAPFIKYAAAASIIGVIAFGAFRLVLNQKTTNKTNNAVAKKTVPPPSVTPEVVMPNGNKDSSSQALVVASNHLPKPKTALERANVATRRKLFQQPGYMTLLADASEGPTNSSARQFQHASLKVAEVPGNCAAISEEDRYLSFMNPDGYLIRISKKLAEALKCYLPTDAQDTPCDEQIKKWRDKIAQYPASASPDNFMDVLNMIKAAQDKEL